MTSVLAALANDYERKFTDVVADEIAAAVAAGDDASDDDVEGLAVRLAAWNSRKPVVDEGPARLRALEAVLPRLKRLTSVLRSTNMFPEATKLLLACPAVTTADVDGALLWCFDPVSFNPDFRVTRLLVPRSSSKARDQAFAQAAQALASCPAIPDARLLDGIEELDEVKPNGDRRVATAPWTALHSLAAAMAEGVSPQRASIRKKTDKAVARIDAVLQRVLARANNVDVTDDEGLTPLHVAVLRLHPERVRMLVAAGADVDAKAKDGRTAAQMARMYAPEVSAKMLAALAPPAR